ncbi:glycoside hydrolase family 43 protein [Chitinophaga sp. 22536]|uniref:glycoside hydrolase family 43 protein n=1 Tax=unclassified Chitinophaga TaxID=2619133 RepID=UPI003F83532D
MMKKYAALLAATTLALTLHAQETKLPGHAGNPVIPGWYADPEGMVLGKKYWIFPTFSAPYEQQVFFDAFSSDDLVHWKKHPHILDSAAVKWAKRAMWAPAVVQKGKQYFFFFGANDIQHNGERGGIGVAVADKPEGPYRDYLGKPLVDSIFHGAQPIDQYVFRDKDGAYYLIYGGWGHCNIARLKDDFTGFIPFADGTVFREITPEKYVEGPTMFMKNGKYYFMWSEGGWTGPDYCVAYAIADSPVGPFKRIGKILEQDETIARGAGHHSVIHNARHDQWFVVYHRRPLDKKGANERETCIDKMEFNADGTIRPVVMTKEGVAALKL